MQSLSGVEGQQQKETLNKTNTDVALHTLREVYQGCHNTEGLGFQASLLGLVGGVLSCDSCTWAIHDGEQRLIDLCLNGLPESFAECFRQVDWQDPIVKAITETPENTCNTALYQHWHQSAIYQNICAPFGIEHVLSTVFQRHWTPFSHTISFFRGTGSPPFSEQERLLAQHIGTHLIEAWRINRRLLIQENVFKELGGAECAALVDHNGEILYFDEGFANILRGNRMSTQSLCLPKTWVDCLHKGRSTLHTADAYRVEARPFADLNLLLVRKSDTLDQLTRRELAVVKLFAEGKTYKEIARDLCISPSTVRNHIHGAYNRLGINNKVQLIKLMQP